MNKRSDQFLNTAYDIGAKLCRDAIWSGNRCNWVGPSMEYMESTWKVVYRSFGTDLYSGTTGIGYFLSYLYQQTNDPVIRKTAMGCFEQALANKDSIHTGARIGFYTGWAGMAKVLQTCSPLLMTDHFNKQTAEILDSLHSCDLQQSGIDVLAGCAGAIPVLIAQQNEQAEECMDTARKIGDHLISIAHKTAKGWSWNTLNPGGTDHSNDLTGFSHGTAGIGWAFLELYHVTTEEKYLDAAQKAFDYERAWFSPQYNNWPDLRASTGEKVKTPESMYGTLAWCHGAPGIGLSRLRAYDLVNDEICKQEAEAAINTTCSMIDQSLQTGQTNYSLCHGIGGNAELLIMAGTSLKDKEMTSCAERAGEAGIRLYANGFSRWPCGITGAGESPGLMLGLSGIGLFYLRLYDPVAIPSILIPLPEEKILAKKLLAVSY